MKMKTIQRTTLLLLGLLFSSTAMAADLQPNVIVIVTDDQGYGDMSCHGNPWLKTPNLDHLASQSVQLEDFHVDPVCTPTRAALMTGRYCTRVGAWTVTQGRQLLRDDEVTMADVFSESGYRTGMFGKWHLGDARPYAPRFRGFDEVVCHLAGGVDEIGNPIGNDFFDDTYFRNGSPESFEGYCTDVFFRELGRFIESDSEEPFFAYLPLNAMHGPHTVEEKYAAPFVAMGHPLKRAKFYGMVINFDQNLGRLMNTLEQRRIEKETIVIFMGDNGTAEGIGGSAESKPGFNAGMRGKKGSTYEGGHRVACFARLPGRFQAGRQVHQLTSHRDWLPTLIDLCDLQSPAGVAFDGQSIAPLLTGSEEPWPDRTFFVQRQADQPTLSKTPEVKPRHPHYAVLTEKWRMVDGQLYDHANDPRQTKDLAREHPEVVENLYSQYEQHFADVFVEGRPFNRFHIGGEENPTRFTVRDWHPAGDSPTASRVIWQQEQLGDDSLLINGFWAVNVVKSGQYAIRLTRFPQDAAAPINANSARVRIGEHTVTQSVEPDAVSVTFDVNLPRGHVLLQAWLTDAETGNERGAYFVEVECLRK
jgi:arylsulfatase A-like enzyme